jgi:hypothetical protein
MTGVFVTFVDTARERCENSNTSSHILNIMALPKSMRLLAFITLGIFFYLCFLIFSSPTEIQAPNTGKIEKMTKDPNLERT